MAKYAWNAYLAQRINFINQIANLCEKNDADVNQVIEAMGKDKRIGSHYWYPGLGYGGSCFPKDVKELAAYSKSVGEGDGIFVKINQLNQRRIPRLMKRFSSKVGGWKGKNVSVLGLSFKPNTDDIRKAPAIQVIQILKQAGAKIIAHDPKANKAMESIYPDIDYKDDPYESISSADVVILLVEWAKLVQLDLKRVASEMNGNWFIDTRNQYAPSSVRDAGLQYIGIGRS